MNVFSKNRLTENQLTKEDEAQILENILARCGKGTNTVPLEELSAYSGYRSERYLLLRAGIVLILIIFLLLPLLFFVPSMTVKERTDTAVNRRAYNVTVSSFIPIRTLTAETDSDTVPVYEAAGKEYIIIPNENGDVHVTVTLQNGQRAETVINVSGIDLDAPTVTGNDYDDNYVYIYLSDASQIDPESLKLTTADGTPREGAAFDTKGSRITVEYPDEDLTISISDIYGNERQIDLHTQN